MNINRDLFLLLVFIFAVAAEDVRQNSVIAGYAPGISGMGVVDPKSCLNDELLRDSLLSSPLECARTCKIGDRRTCYYKFVIERYPVNGHACDLCMPNATNTLCADCQCVPGDGTQRMALTVNRMMPGPSIQVCEGDYVVVDVVNMLKSDSVTIHWHGVYLHGAAHYDGVPHLTQCPILIQETFRYQFSANNIGTHLWHAHTSSQKMDGIFGSFIVREPVQQEPYMRLYDYDLANHVIIANDWFKDESVSRVPGRRDDSSHKADMFLINGKGKFVDPTGKTTNVPYEVITVEANKRYRFRFINSFCTICSAQLMIEGHNFIVIASDGQPIKPVEVDSIVTYAGERYDFVINADQTPGAYWIQLRGLDACKDTGVQQLAILQYEGASDIPKTLEPTQDNSLPSKITLDIAGDGCDMKRSDQICASELKHALPVGPDILKKVPDVKFDFAIGVHKYTEEELFKPNTYRNFLLPSKNSIVAQTLNNITSVSPPVPPLSQLDDIPTEEFCNADNLPSHCSSEDMCSCIHLVKIPLNSVVEINLIDEFGAKFLRHPFHLHGYTFHVIGMGQPLGPINSTNAKMSLDYFKELEMNDELEKNFDSPSAKDTIPVPNNGYATIRFRASNPGFWMLHCHQIFHQMAGMDVTLQVGEPGEMPKTPEGFPKCGNFMPNVMVRYGKDEQ